MHTYLLICLDGIGPEYLAASQTPTLTELGRRGWRTIGQGAMMMSGKDGDAAFVDIRSIGGLTEDVNRKLSQQVSKLLKDSLGIPSDRVYLNFTDVEAGNWGWNGNTFG